MSTSFQQFTTDSGRLPFFKGDKSDIAVSYEDYMEIIEVIHDERLSRKALMNFKNLREANFYGSMGILLGCFPPAMALTYWFVGPTRRSHASYRIQWPYFLTAYPVMCWIGFTTPIPKQLYTKILADTEEDGAYVRNVIKMKKPGLFRKLSKELYRKGHRLPEMHEVTENQIHFPTDIVTRF